MGKFIIFSRATSENARAPYDDVSYLRTASTECRGEESGNVDRSMVVGCLVGND